MLALRYFFYFNTIALVWTDCQFGNICQQCIVVSFHALIEIKLISFLAGLDYTTKINQMYFLLISLKKKALIPVCKIEPL